MSPPAGTRLARGATATSQGVAAPPVVQEVLRAPGLPLDPGLRADMEQRLGHDFAAVRVHTDARAAESARAVDANAYTVGRHIVLAEGRYRPHTSEGRRLLAHELTHVVQQPAAVPGRGAALRVSDPADPAEREAEATATLLSGRALQRLGRDRLRLLPVSDRPLELHRQVPRVTTTVTKPGTPAPIEPIGVQGGSVEVRTGEDVESVDIMDSKRLSVENTIAIAYQGPSVGTSHWLQFVWNEIGATVPDGNWPQIGTMRTAHAGNQPLTLTPSAPSWWVDTASKTSPYYEAAGLRLPPDSGSLTIFDRPGGPQHLNQIADNLFRLGVGVTEVTYTAHFDTYLVQDDLPVYHVVWAAETKFTEARAGTAGPGTLLSAQAEPVTYTVGASGDVSSLPAGLRAVLRASFPGVKFKGEP